MWERHKEVVSALMASQSSFRQVDEKHIPVEVELLSWNPRMDLICIANIHGEVYLHRLSWQKVWTLRPSKEGELVKAFSWCPDGTQLAVGYSNGTVLLVDVENADHIHSYETNSSISCMSWTATESSAAEETSCPYFTDSSAKYLPKLPPLAKSYAGAVGCKHAEEQHADKKVKDNSVLNILTVGCVNGTVHLLAFGIYPIGKVTVRDSAKVTAAVLTNDLSMISIIVDSIANEKHAVHLCTLRTDLLNQHKQELQVVSSKYCQISSLMAYMDSTIAAMKEAWEDILLEMDLKLASFAQKKAHLGTGTVSDDFLQLLMFGTCSDELQQFLLNELTEKGLKKLGRSLETSYSNVQKLVLKHLQAVTQALMYHMHDVVGMANWQEKFGALGLSQSAVDAARCSIGSFMLKATELQQVIDNSMKNFKAFFRWLYVVILRLSGEAIMPEMNKVTQQDLIFVAEFLKDSFTEEAAMQKDPEGATSSSGVHLERVGQYLKNSPLYYPPDTSTNPWAQKLANCPLLRENPLQFKHEVNKSLLQQDADLREAITAAFASPIEAIGGTIVNVALFGLLESDKHIRSEVRFLNLPPSSLMLSLCVTDHNRPLQRAYIFKQCSRTMGDLDCMSLEFGPISIQNESTGLNQIVDMQFYDSDTLSLLLHSDHCAPVLAQFPLSTLKTFVSFPKVSDVAQFLQEMAPVNGSNILNAMNSRCLENMKAAAVAVSGTRKVACVVFSSKKRVRLFEMDVEDEDDDDNDEDITDRSLLDIGEDDKEN